MALARGGPKSRDWGTSNLNRHLKRNHGSAHEKLLSHKEEKKQKAEKRKMEDDKFVPENVGNSSVVTQPCSKTQHSEIRHATSIGPGPVAKGPVTGPDRVRDSRSGPGVRTGGPVVHYNGLI